MRKLLFVHRPFQSTTSCVASDCAEEEAQGDAKKMELDCAEEDPEETEEEAKGDAKETETAELDRSPASNGEASSGARAEHSNDDNMCTAWRQACVLLLAAFVEGTNPKALQFVQVREHHCHTVGLDTLSVV